MSTTTIMNDAQRPLAEHAWNLKKEIRRNDISKRLWMEMYDDGEIQLSSVYENLFVNTRNWMNLKTEKASVDGYDFVKISGNKKIPLGDMKTTVLQQDRKYRRYVIHGIKNKQGILYVVGYNRIKDSFDYFAIPTEIIPKVTVSIGVDPETGDVLLDNKYGEYYYSDFRSMILGKRSK
jgi:hypothetical protein